MSKRQVIMLLGALIITLPFLGFTSFWDMIINVVAGVTIIGIAYQMVPMMPMTQTGKNEKIAQNTKDVGDISSTENNNEINSMSNSPDHEVHKESANIAPAQDLPFVDHLSSTEGGATNIK